MPRVSDLKDSRFLTKHDVEHEVTVTIKSYEKLNVAMESQAPEEKWTLSFHELPKPLVLNNTNGQLLEIITGSDNFDDWLEKKIVLWHDPTVSFGGKFTGGIRIKAVQGQGFDQFKKDHPVEQDGKVDPYDDGSPKPTDADAPTTRL